LSTHSPDSVIAPWLESVQPQTLWVIGETTPPVVTDYQIHSHNSVVTLKPQEIGANVQMPSAALIAHPLNTLDDLLLAGQLRNLLISDILCFVNRSIPADSLYALAFKRGDECQETQNALLSFHYSLATYNHTRAWNNPKFWANPENWNKYWW
jgi:hypothetical protein